MGGRHRKHVKAGRERTGAVQGMRRHRRRDRPRRHGDSGDSHEEYDGIGRLGNQRGGKQAAAKEGTRSVGAKWTSDGMRRAMQRYSFRLMGTKFNISGWRHMIDLDEVPGRLGALVPADDGGTRELTSNYLVVSTQPGPAFQAHHTRTKLSKKYWYAAGKCQNPLG